ncbi:MAG: amidohydrolase family protein [Tissierellaceae bacterium]|nr:amidohydrolase family protein [Tissierellaceae bacterium]
MLLLKSGNLIDGVSDESRKNVSVLIDGDKIVKVGKYEELSVGNSGVKEIDCYGKTIMPGLIDAHVHLIYQNVSEPYTIELSRSLEEATGDAFYTARQLLSYGITTIRDVGTRGNISVTVRNAVSAGMFPGPRIKASSRIISTVGGLGDFHPTHLFEEHKYRYGLGELILGTDQAKAAVRIMTKDGVDFIKVEASGTGFNPLCPAERNTINYDELLAIVGEAKKNDLYVACHAESISSVKMACKAKVHDIQHGIFIDDEAVEMMLENDIRLVPTLGMYWGFIEDGPANGIPQAIIDDHLKTHEHHVRSIQRCMDAGVKIAAGSDAGLTHFPQGGVRDEICRYVEIGMKPMDAIKTATSNGAECLEVDDIVGTIEEGKFADILVLNGDPIKDIKCIKNEENLDYIIQNGKIVKHLFGFSN